jgi:uncharacterized membrane protein YeiH
MGFFGGIGGGITRDVLLNDIPSPFKDPTYFVVCVSMGFLGVAIYRYADSMEERFRTRMLAYFKSFTLPWFAVLGAHKALEHDLGIFAAILVGLIATTAGGVLIDLFSDVTPEIVRPSEHLVTTAVLASSVYAVIAVQMKDRVEFFPVTLIAVLAAFVFRVIAVREHWAQIVPLSGRAAGPRAHPEEPPLKKASGSNWSTSSRVIEGVVWTPIDSFFERYGRKADRTDEVQARAPAAHGRLLCGSLGTRGCQSGKAAVFMGAGRGRRAAPGHDWKRLEKRRPGVHSRRRTRRRVPTVRAAIRLSPSGDRRRIYSGDRAVRRHPWVDDAAGAATPAA